MLSAHLRKALPPRVSSLLTPAQMNFDQQMDKYTSQPKILKIRKTKMRKMKRRKRQKKDWWQNKAKQLAKKNKSEALFRSRMHALLNELERFDPMEYVKETMGKARMEWEVDLAPTGRKRYPHWSTLMSLEELFGVEKGDYIDKRYGLPSMEERPMLDKMRQEYRQKYILDEPVKLLEKIGRSGPAKMGKEGAEKEGGG